MTLVEPGALAEGEPRPVLPVHPEDLGYLVYSSGSTGRPKGAMHAHQDLRAGIETYAREVLALTPGDRCHSMARLFTSLGFGNGFFRVLGSGATAVLSAGALPTPRSVLGTVERHGVTVLTAVPTFWSQLARFLERHPDAGALASVRLAVSSGDGLPASVGRPAPGGDGTRPDRGAGVLRVLEHRHLDTAGRAAPGHARARRARVWRSGSPTRRAPPWARASPGACGSAAPPTPPATGAAWPRPGSSSYGPWLRMGDVLSQEDGVYRHLGRSDDLFKVDARWVSPVEVEAAILTAPGRRRGRGRGPARATTGSLARPAFVVLAPDARDGDGGRTISPPTCGGTSPAGWSPTRRPRRVAVLDELPRLPSGKLDRRRLRTG